VTDLAHHLTQILGRIEAASASRTYSCAVCGCLCLRGESCPSCALNHVKEIA
jgi:rubrerythrin